ncbi:hypothetical protein SUGI_0175920 [Cryptomeria japonica]|uniref:uncharacterized protein LOC131035272 n=1 Tax=Cryptomeria japonica TaxID=3369 RepID=UPI002408EA94|nr:uncharacterized protein LOC131035272 [Cryptomeria japonica]GLJ11740.1 hypothetical protein SUGI_0175920 [Cryptomeria japonica]
MTVVTHIPRLEVIETAAEVADLAIKAFQHKDESSNRLQYELEKQLSENQRLRAELENVCKTVQKIQLLHNCCLNKCEDPTACGIRYPRLDDCPSDLYERIRNTVESSNFLTKLNTLTESGEDTVDDPGKIEEFEGDTMVNVNLEDPSWWLWVTDDMVPSNVVEKCGLDNEGYIVVTEEDIVDAISIFIANCIFSDPQGKKMTPEQLQKFLSTALESMNRRNKIKKLWNAGKFMYSATTWGITAIGFYRHPFILRSALKMLLACGRILVKAV